MKLVFLGTAGYHPNESRHTTCVALPEIGIVFDAGTGLFRLPAYLQTPRIDILLSHAHLDHVVGLTYLLDILYQHPMEQVRVHGDAEKLKSLRENLFRRRPVSRRASVCRRGIGRRMHDRIGQNTTLSTSSSRG